MYDKYVEKGKATVVSPPVQDAPRVYALVALLLSLAPCALARGTESVEVRVGYLGPRDTPAERGVQLGIEEANVQGRFTGRSFRLQLLSELGEVSPRIRGRGGGRPGRSAGRSSRARRCRAEHRSCG